MAKIISADMAGAKQQNFDLGARAELTNFMEYAQARIWGVCTQLVRVSGLDLMQQHTQGKYPTSVHNF